MLNRPISNEKNSAVKFFWSLSIICYSVNTASGYDLFSWVIIPIFTLHQCYFSSLNHFNSTSNTVPNTVLEVELKCFLLSYNRFQSAHRRGYSTVTALTRLLNDVYINANQQSSTLLLQLDLSAALDTIDQETLISRPEINFGIFLYTLQWLHSYLSDRSQFVSVGDRWSRTTKREFGVPQGSFWVHCSSNCTCHQSQTSSTVSASVTVRRRHSVISLKDESSLSSLSAASSVFTGSSHWTTFLWILINLKLSSLTQTLDSDLRVLFMSSISAMFKFNRQNVSVVSALR